jgi:translation initiation factor 2 subunit 1
VVPVRGVGSILPYASDGIEIIKEALTGAESVDKKAIEISYLGSGNYKVEVTADEYKEAETILKQALDTATKAVEKSDGGKAEFTRA